MRTIIGDRMKSQPEVLRVEPKRKGFIKATQFCFVIRSRSAKFNVYYVVYILYIYILNNCEKVK